MTSKKHFLPRKAPALFGATYGREVEIVLDKGGATAVASYMGSGRFTTTYRCGSEVILYTFYNDFSKSILSHASREYGKTNPHLPKITRIGRLTHEDDIVNVYKARYYRRVVASKLNPTNLSIVVALQEAHDEACHAFPENIVRKKAGHEFNEIVTNAKGIPKAMRLALEHLSHVSLDWGDHYIFDNFHVRNLGLDQRGRLVLIDPMFDMARIQRDHDYRRKSGRTRA